MRDLLFLIATLICLHANAQRYGDPKEYKRNLLLLDGGFIPLVAQGSGYSSNVNEPSAPTYTLYQFGIGYRYWVSDHFRIGVNVECISDDLPAFGGVFFGGVGLDFPYEVADGLYITPGINLDIYPLIPQVHLGIMYNISNTVALNVEPGIQLYILNRQFQGYSVPLLAGFRFLF
jgi:hypothetical protein